MFSLLTPYYFFKDVFLISYDKQVYVVVYTILYLYTLPINHLLTSFSSFCPSYNLTQA